MKKNAIFTRQNKKIKKIFYPRYLLLFAQIHDNYVYYIFSQPPKQPKNRFIEKKSRIILSNYICKDNYLSVYFCWGKSPPLSTPFLLRNTQTTKSQCKGTNKNTKMNKTNNSKTIPQERITRAKKLMLFVAASRVKTYYGTLEKFEKAMHDMRRWNGYTRTQKAAYSKSWGKIAAERCRFNACFSIPSTLINDIIGRGRDDNGKLFRYSPHQMIDQMGDFLKVVFKHGRKFKKVDGKFAVAGSWGTKYIINEKLFHKLWTDDSMQCYFNLATLGDKRLQDLIAKYYRQDAKQTTTHETQEEIKMETTPRYAANVPHEDIDEPQPKPQPKPQAAKPKPQTTKPQTNTPSKVLARLQEFVDRDLITAGEAELMVDCYGVKMHIAKHVNGLMLQDVCDMTKENLTKRGTILVAFLGEMQGRALTEKQGSFIRSTIKNADDIKKRLGGGKQ